MWYFIKQCFKYFAEVQIEIENNGDNRFNLMKVRASYQVDLVSFVLHKPTFIILCQPFGFFSLPLFFFFYFPSTASPPSPCPQDGLSFRWFRVDGECWILIGRTVFLLWICVVLYALFNVSICSCTSLETERGCFYFPL